jgi:hypothetical protein
MIKSFEDLFDKNKEQCLFNFLMIDKVFFSVESNTFFEEKKC